MFIFCRIEERFASILGGMTTVFAGYDKIDSFLDGDRLVCTVELRSLLGVFLDRTGYIIELEVGTSTALCLAEPNSHCVFFCLFLVV